MPPRRTGPLPACLALLGAALLGAAPARAFLSFSSFSSSVTPLGGVNFLYSYQVTLASGSFSSPLSELDVPLSAGGPIGATLANIKMPTGFTAAYTPGATGLRFVSASPALDLQPGGSGTFSFTSLSVPATQALTLRTDDGTGSTVVVNGYAPGPLAAAVPEAPAGALLLLGLLPLAPLAARRRPHAG